MWTTSAWYKSPTINATKTATIQFGTNHYSIFPSFGDWGRDCGTGRFEPPSRRPASAASEAKEMKAGVNTQAKQASAAYVGGPNSK